MKCFTSITRKISFSAAHRLHNVNWSDEKNAKVYGICNNLHGHGHNYDLEVTVHGQIDQESGMILNINTLKEILNEEIINKFDRKNLNEIPDLKGTITTMENLAKKIAELLIFRFEQIGLSLLKVKLSESKKNYVTIEIL